MEKIELETKYYSDKYHNDYYKDVTYKGRVFTFEQGISASVDSYDPYLGSVEQSSRDYLNFYNLIKFSAVSADVDLETLDLTWMDGKDCIDLAGGLVTTNPNSKTVRKLLVNMNNVDVRTLWGFYDIDLEVYNNNTHMNPIDQIKNMYNCLSYSEKHKLNSIKFVGFNPIMKAAFETMANARNVEVIKEREIEAGIQR